MSTHTSRSTTEASQAKRKSLGWAAFDAQHRQNQGDQTKVGKDPYPPMPSALPSSHPCGNLSRNKVISARSFSSTLLPSMNFPAPSDSATPVNFSQAGESGGEKALQGESCKTALDKLKELYDWADSSLIEDVLLTVDYDIDKASNLLKGMTSSGNCDKNNETGYACKMIDQDNLPMDAADLAAEIADLSPFLDGALTNNHKELTDSSASRSSKSSSEDTTDNMERILKHLRSIPVEPEWEEDDVYLSCRKNALSTIRSASRHSRAATNAFLRGDHFSAQQHSLKAEDLWLAAEGLNAKAAKEILSVRNYQNEQWILDLHGLHALEAVHVLQEHLQKLETHVPTNHLASQDTIKINNGYANSSHSVSYNGNAHTIDKQQKALRQRPASIEVITGVGKHSRGKASLPSAVRSFLQINRYRFDETRPGTITVWPKYQWK